MQICWMGKSTAREREVWELLEGHALGACACSTPEKHGYNEVYLSPVPMPVPAGVPLYSNPGMAILPHPPRHHPDPTLLLFGAGNQDSCHDVWPLPLLWLHL